MLLIVAAVALATHSTHGQEASHEELRRLLQSDQRDDVIKAMDAVYQDGTKPLYRQVV